MAGRGYSASEIARELGHRSRSAIIGFCQREGIRLKARPWKNGRANGAPPVPRPPAPPKPAPSAPILPPSNKSVSLNDAEAHHCRFIVSEPRDLLICGAEIHLGPYCRYHAAMCLLPQRAKQP